MTKTNPDDSVRLEQSATPENVAGTEDNMHEKIEPYFLQSEGKQKGYVTGQIQIGEVLLGILDLEKLLLLE